MFISNHEEYGDCIFKIIGLKNEYNHILDNKIQFNIWQCNKKEWLFDINENRLFFDHIDYYQPRGLIIENKILIITITTKVLFYDISEIIQPRYIGHYEIENEICRKWYGYYDHGMICLNKTTIKKENNDRGELTLLLFGGDKHLDKTFLEIKIIFANGFDSIKDINIPKLYSKKNPTKLDRTSLDVRSKLIKVSEKYIQLSKSVGESVVWTGFGWCPVVLTNKKGVRKKCVVIIGKETKNVHVYDCETTQLLRKKDVLPQECYNPMMIAHCDHIHVITRIDHFLINLNALGRILS